MGLSRDEIDTLVTSLDCYLAELARQGGSDSEDDYAAAAALRKRLLARLG